MCCAVTNTQMGDAVEGDGADNVIDERVRSVGVSARKLGGSKGAAGRIDGAATGGEKGPVTALLQVIERVLLKVVEPVPSQTHKRVLF